MVAIIIPVYNLANELNRCILSVLSQTYSSWELILVDDGSSDGSSWLCDQFAYSDPRIRVIHQQNMGAAAARNTGIRETKKLKTDYIIFLDGDDWWNKHLLEKMMTRITHDHTMLAACGYYRVECDERISEVSTVPETPVIWDVYECYNNAAVIGTGPTRKLINATLLNNLEFPRGKLFEDEFFTYKLLYLAGKTSIVNEHLYYYYQRPGSLMHSPVSAKGIADKMEALYGREKFFLGYGEKELAAKAKANALVSNAKEVILAIQSKRYTKKEFPDQYRMSKLRSLYYIHKYCSNDNFHYFFGKMYPNRTKLIEYLNKIHSVIRE